MDIKHDLDLDLMRSEHIVNKCSDKIYAQHLYAAMCNNIFVKDNQKWMTSWRAAGGIVADIRNCGEDYIDWYCSGIGDIHNHMPEGNVSDEIRKDLLELGWKTIIHNDAKDDGLY